MLFTGEGAEQYEALKDALCGAARDWGNDDIYTYLNNVPKTSLVVELVNRLHFDGWKIVRAPSVSDGGSSPASGVSSPTRPSVPVAGAPVEPSEGSLQAADTPSDCPEKNVETRWAVNEQHQITRDGKPIKFRPASGAPTETEEEKNL